MPNLVTLKLVTCTNSDPWRQSRPLLLKGPPPQKILICEVPVHRSYSGSPIRGAQVAETVKPYVERMTPMMAQTIATSIRTMYRL